MKNFSTEITFKILLLIFFFSPGFELLAQSQDRPLVVVTRFKPNVIVDKQSAEATKVLNIDTDKGEKLFSGDTLRTDSEGYALVLFLDKSIAKIKPNSLLIVMGEDERTSKKTSRRISLEQGEVFLDIEPQGSNDFEVVTSTSLASIKGTRFGGKSDGFYWVESGQIDVSALNSGETVSLFQNMFAKVDDNGNNIESGELSEQEMNALKDGYQVLDENLERKEIRFRFRDENGQLREVIINIIEKGN